MEKFDLAFGDIVWTRFDPGIGYEFQGKRPAIVIQSNDKLLKSNLITVIPLTSKTGNVTGDDFIIKADAGNNLSSDSVAKVYCITSFDYSRFEKKIGVVGNNILLQVKKYLKKHFGI